MANIKKLARYEIKIIICSCLRAVNYGLSHHSTFRNIDGHRGDQDQVTSTVMVRGPDDTLTFKHLGERGLDQNKYEIHEMPKKCYCINYLSS